MDKLVILLFETLGVLAFAAGVGFFAGRWIGSAAVGVAGLVLLVGAWAAERRTSGGR